MESRIGSGEDHTRVTTTRVETVDEPRFDFGQACTKANALAISPTGTAYVAAPHRLIAIDRP
jgi:hypothetical protein